MSYPQLIAGELPCLISCTAARYLTDYDSPLVRYRAAVNDSRAQMHQPQVRGTWVQTERRAHEAWAQLVASKPRAAQLLHLLVAHMNRSGVLVASHATLAALAGVSTATIKRAVADLVGGAWIQTTRIGSERGGALAYIVNRRVAWADKRENLSFALFDARVLVSSADQDTLDGPDLRPIPTLYPGEQTLPAGPGLPPPSQPPLSGLEPEMLALRGGRDSGSVDMLPGRASSED